MSGTTTAATTPAAARVYARIVNGTVMEIHTVPAVHAEIPLSKLFPPGLAWVALNQAGVVPGWTEASGVFSAPIPVVQPKPTRITPLSFMSRFTDAETAALHAAALGNAQIFGFMIMTAAAGEIDLTDARVKAGLDALVAAGLLAATREAEILTP